MLQDFRQHLYTDFIFGKDAECQIGTELKRLGATRALLVYGSGRSIQANGLLDRIKSLLANEGITTFELSGVQPNPRVSKVREGIALCRKENVDFLVAIGGGSVIDTCKAIGIGFYYDGDVWDLSTGAGTADRMLSLSVVLTYPAAGSESSTGAIISNDDQVPFVKSGIGGPFSRPVIAFENPELTYSLPPYLTACGIADMYVHILERYFSPVDVGSMDYLAEGMLRAVIDFGKRTMADPNNYDNRAEIMWLGTIAHNNTVGLGRPQDWSTHALGHEISALYDTAHGATLTITGPAWMKYVYPACPARFARYAREVFGIQEADDEKAALAGIQATIDFYHALGLPASFAEAGLPEDQIQYMADHAAELKGGTMGAFRRLTAADNLEIYKLSL